LQVRGPLTLVGAQVEEHEAHRAQGERRHGRPQEEKHHLVPQRPADGLEHHDELAETTRRATPSMRELTLSALRSAASTETSKPTRSSAGTKLMTLPASRPPLLSETTSTE